jgi:hypothetical protein
MQGKLLVTILLVVLALPGAAHAGAVSRGQLLYVPVYSEIPFGEGKRTLSLTATLSLRNVDTGKKITIRRADYYDSQGRLVRSYLQEPRVIGPLSSFELLVKESDRSGGISASFLVQWDSDSPVLAPVAESIMIGAFSGQGISFVGRARVLEERRN